MFVQANPNNYIVFLLSIEIINHVDFFTSKYPLKYKKVLNSITVYRLYYPFISGDLVLTLCARPINEDEINNREAKLPCLLKDLIVTPELTVFLGEPMTRLLQVYIVLKVARQNSLIGLCPYIRHNSD